MTSLNVIKLNASQELALVRARDKALGHDAPLVFDKERGLVKQAVKRERRFFCSRFCASFRKILQKKNF